MNSYCIKCGEDVHPDCRKGNMCFECYDIETSNDKDMEFSVSLKQILIPLKQNLKPNDFNILIEIINLWQLGLFSKGDNKLLELKQHLSVECCKLLKIIENFVVYGKGIPDFIDIPKSGYYKLPKGFNINPNPRK